MPYNPAEPFSDVRVNHKGEELLGTAHGSGVIPGLLLKINIGTYGNGYEVCSAAFPSSQTIGGDIFSCQITGRAPGSISTTPFDKTTAITAGLPITVVRHEKGKEYWLKGSSLTTLKHSTKLTCAANGLVEVQTAHTATAKLHHYWVASGAYSAATWVRGVYNAEQMMFTAN